MENSEESGDIDLKLLIEGSRIEHGHPQEIVHTGNTYV